MRLLFLCTGNSCRSQMAEGFARALLPSDIEIYSAGIQADGMNPYAIQVMAEEGIDITGQSSKTTAAVPWNSMDWVITLCDHAKESCPALLPNVEHRHWPMRDPALTKGTLEERLEVYRAVRDEIRQRMVEFAETPLWESAR